MKKMAAGSFKIHCLAVMDEVQAKRETGVITKRGKPVAKLIPADSDSDDIYNFPSVTYSPVGRWNHSGSSMPASTMLS